MNTKLIYFRSLLPTASAAGPTTSQPYEISLHSSRVNTFQSERTGSLAVDEEGPVEWTHSSLYLPTSFIISSALSILTFFSATNFPATASINSPVAPAAMATCRAWSVMCPR